LREERKLRVFENMVLRRTVGPRRDEVMGEWRRLHNGAESFVFQVAIQKFKDQDIQNYKIACCFVWVWNLVVDIAGGKEAEGV